ncbi:MAG TPA: hypothetical protein VGR28_00955 [Candidatus Thermoplasmatota archaeon]|nr:hypothetical protein [Candidatus Thermoplasmatota archaeon]
MVALRTLLLVTALLAAPLLASLAAPAQYGDPYGDPPEQPPGQPPGNNTTAPPPPPAPPASPDPPARAQAQDQAAAWGSLSSAQRAEGQLRAEQARLFAGFTASNGTASGRFVRFGYNASAGDVRNVEVIEANATFLAVVHMAPWGGNVTEDVAGAALRVGTDKGSLTAHDAPTALMAWRGAGMVFQIALGPNVTANITNKTARLVAPNGAHAHLLIAGNGTLAGVGAAVVGAVAPGTLVFLAHPANTSVAASLHERLDALAAGQLGGEISVVEGGGAPVPDGESFGVRLHAEEASEGRVRVRASSDDPAGKAVVVRTDTATVPVGGPDEVRVLVDGVAAARAANALEALNATTGQGKAWVDVASGGVQVIVALGNFSDHLIEVAAPAPEPPADEGPGSDDQPADTPPAGEAPKGAPGLGALAAVAVLGALARRRRR